MRENLQIRVKKLALAYETGWEYMPGSEEPGSVLMDIFLEMADENQKRFGRIWEKQERVFLQAVPEIEEESGGGRGALLVEASEEEDGKWLEEGTEAYTLQEGGQPVCFHTACAIQLTAAKLKYAVYQRGLCAWLIYGGEEVEVLSHPIFRWRFRGLCDGRKDFCFAVDFVRTNNRMETEDDRTQHYARTEDGQTQNGAETEDGRTQNGVETEDGRAQNGAETEDGRTQNGVETKRGGQKYPETALPGTWSISDGTHCYSIECEQTASGCLLTGRTPEFAHNLTGEMYEICLEIPAQEELPAQWLEILCMDMVLTGAPEEKEPDICLTDSGADGGGRVFPFGTSPEEAACCYLACDSIMACGKTEMTIRFREVFQEEEKLPEPRPEELRKLYKKYPWLQMTETVQEWQTEDTVWEYFNGNMWRILPESEKWKTLCEVDKAGEKTYRWKCPEDMRPCAVEGEVHLYIRLRLNRVRNAFAPYYRKAIPVLEEIRFSVGERSVKPVEQILPHCAEAEEERMYLGFDREITPHNCWYTGENICSFSTEQIRGRDHIFGKDAFWVEPGEKKAENPACFLPNYVPVLQWKTQGEAQDRQLFISVGTDFSVQPGNMGILEAVCVGDIRCGGTGAPILLEKQAAEHYFMHFGRLLTPMDMEMILQERYPFLKVSGCRLQQTDKKLTVEIEIVKDKENIHKMQVLQEEAHSRLAEIQEWLELAAAKRGPVWLRDCRVSCCLQETQGIG